MHHYHRHFFVSSQWDLLFYLNIHKKRFKGGDLRMTGDARFSGIAGLRRQNRSHASGTARLRLQSIRPIRLIFSWKANLFLSKTIPRPPSTSPFAQWASLVEAGLRCSEPRAVYNSSHRQNACELVVALFLPVTTTLTVI